MLKSAPSRHALNSRRYRIRKARGQGVFYLTAHKERLRDLLVQKGYLRDGVVHSHAMVALALARWVDHEGKI